MTGCSSRTDRTVSSYRVRLIAGGVRPAGQKFDRRPGERWDAHDRLKLSRIDEDGAMERRVALASVIVKAAGPRHWKRIRHT
jgi:hypothetical protein